MALVVVGGLAWMVQARLGACGPGFVEGVFRDIHRPDTSWEEAVRGRLGIIRPGLPKEHLILAYRHLMNLPVEVNAWNPKVAVPSSADEGPAEPAGRRWEKAMAALLGSEAGPRLDSERVTPTYQWFSNVGDHAFQVALDTLQARQRVHGATSPDVLLWAKAQNQVFRSTPKDPRIPESVISPEWLRKDRDYQRAAALFYADRWDEARAAFAAISKDSQSPWRAWSGFLLARCRMRQASLGPEGESLERWQQARAHLEALLEDASFASVHEDARAYLEFVRYRLEPQVLRAEAMEGLAAIRSGPAWLEQLRQADRFIKNRGVALPEPGVSKQAADLQTWLSVMGGEKPSPAFIEAKWKETRSLPWLVAGRALLPAGHALQAELMEAAAEVPRTSPAWPSLDWHRIRLELDSMPSGTRQALVERTLEEERPPWAENAIRIQGRASARNLDEWAAWAPSRLVALQEAYSPPDGPADLPESTARRYGAKPLLLAPSEAAVINVRFPLGAWVALAESKRLPAPLRADIAQAGWVRAVFLEDWNAERRLRPLLDGSLKSAIPHDFGDLPALDRAFQTARILMANPGLSILVQGGLGRSNHGWVPLTEAVDFGTNWWCLPASGGEKVQVPSFLSEADLEAGQKEWARLEKIRSARHWFGQTVIAYAERRPEDLAVPWTLHRFIRITRNAECYDQDLSRLGKRAFNILHRRYPGSPWTRKTPVYY